MNELHSKEFLYTIHTELHDRPKLRDALLAILKGLAEDTLTHRNEIAELGNQSTVNENLIDRTRQDLHDLKNRTELEIGRLRDDIDRMARKS